MGDAGDARRTSSASSPGSGQRKRPRSGRGRSTPPVGTVRPPTLEAVARHSATPRGARRPHAVARSAARTHASWRVSDATSPADGPSVAASRQLRARAVRASRDPLDGLGAAAAGGSGQRADLRAAMAESTPLTNRPESSVREPLGQLDGLVDARPRSARRAAPAARSVAIAQHGRGRCTGMRSSVQPRAWLGDRARRSRSRWSSTPSTSSTASGSGGDRQRGQHVAAGDALRLGLVQQAAAPARGRPSGGPPARARRRRRHDPGDVLAGAGVDLHPVAGVRRTAAPGRPCRSRAWPACGHPTPGRPARPARSRRS